MGQGCGFLNVRHSVLRMLIFPLARCLLKEKVEKNDMCRLAGLPKGPFKLIFIADEMFCKTRQMIMRRLMHWFYMQGEDRYQREVCGSFCKKSLRMLQ